MATKAQRASTKTPATSTLGQRSAQTHTRTNIQTNILGSQENIATAMLKADHRKVEQLFKKYEQLEDEGQKREIAHQICQELIVHTMLEEEIFYPACREKAGEDEEDTDALDQAQVEHDSAKTLINELLTERPGSSYYDAKVAVLSEYIKHHVAEEEKPADGIFATAEKAGIDMAELGQKLQARKSTLLAKGKNLTQRGPKPRSLHINFNQRDSTQEDQDMNQRRNYGGREQDQRFRDDEERYGSRSYGSGRYTGYEDQDRGYGRRMMRDNDRDEDYGQGSYGQGSYGQGNYGQGGGGRYSESTSHARATYEPQEGRYGSRGYDEQYGREAYEAERYRGGSRRGYQGGYQGQDYEGGGSYEGGRSSQGSQGGRYRQGGYQGGSYQESGYQGGRQGRGEYGGGYGGSSGYGGQRSSRYSSQSRGGRYGDDLQERDWEGGLEGVSRRRGWESQGGGRYQNEDDDDRYYGRGNWQNRD